VVRGGLVRSIPKEWLLKRGSGSILGVLVVGLGVLAAGCGIHPKRDGGGAPIVSESPDHAPSQEYRIGPEDVLEVVIWKNADLSKIVTVRPDGMITLPLIGELQAGGLTANEVRDGIKARLERFKEIPEVSVTVADVRSYNLYILGEVRTPGRYQVKSHTTLLQVLALAGGFTPFAATEKIILVRRDQHANEQRVRIRYRDLIKRGDVGLSPGDTVIVP
jgi:polysaccharide export outer membrane protein